MGGCVGGKPEPEESPADPTQDVKKRKTKRVERRESQRPWNRHSAQVYCGDPKPKPGTSPDKPPDVSDDKDKNKENSDGPQATFELGSSSPTPNGVIFVQSSESPEIKVDEADEPLVSHGLSRSVHSINTAGSMGEISENESKDSVPDILKESGHRFYPPPLIAPFDPCDKIVKRPRSLDSAVHFGNGVKKARPVSFSPALMKTRHPRSLHSINTAAMNELKTPPTLRQRPQSMDMSAFFEVKGFDIHTQKLRRLLTQKSPKKNKESKSSSSTAVVPYQVLQLPGQVKYIEEGPSRCFQPSQMEARKNKNRDLKLKELEYLRKAISKPRLKFSKSLEIFFQRNEQYYQYDPILNEKAAQPSNPWVSEDETMWDINRNLVEVPTEARIRKWALSFEELLQDETGRNEFEQFLKKEYSLENIRFYKACKQLMVCPQSHVPRWKEDIIKEFLTPGAACEVNVDCKTLELVLQQKGHTETSSKTRHVFQPAMDHVYVLMKKDSYTRFLRSEQYKLLLEKSQSHYTKKRFFSFGGSNRKKAPSPMVNRRRGSASSDGGLGEDTMGGSYHSYSTGNLREFDEKPRHALRQSNSPSLRRRTDNMEPRNSSGQDARRRSNLEVPGVSTYSSKSSDPSRKSESLAPCLAISVPRTNIVAPWEGNS